MKRATTRNAQCSTLWDGCIPKSHHDGCNARGLIPQVYGRLLARPEERSAVTIERKKIAYVCLSARRNSKSRLFYAHCRIMLVSLAKTKVMWCSPPPSASPCLLQIALSVQPWQLEPCIFPSFESPVCPNGILAQCSVLSSSVPLHPSSNVVSASYFTSHQYNAPHAATVSGSLPPLS